MTAGWKLLKISTMTASSEITKAVILTVAL